MGNIQRRMRIFLKGNRRGSRVGDGSSHIGGVKERRENREEMENDYKGWGGGNFLRAKDEKKNSECKKK